MSIHEKIEFMCISFMHDTLYSLFMKPEKLLLPAGLQKDQKVLEVGCGPGFFTIPAAQIVGKNGIVYAIDINPYAIKKVEKKISKEKITNVRVSLLNVTTTGLPEKSINLAFFFGIIHNLVDIIDEVIFEMDRILTKDGTISIQKSWKKSSDIIKMIEESGKFVLMEETKRLINFRKT
ncbi:MAG TPA: class I SAM-dependent methyltransferase [candidate division Zixibacteria bacterium]|nr:class I SAM-dependent methyltransferase [candidate division Zixibacteria bacterium]